MCNAGFVLVIWYQIYCRLLLWLFFFQAEDGIRYLVRSRGLGDVYKRQGLRRGRRHPDEVYVGESLDFWRVETVEKNTRLRLLAEMKVPGEAWLEFESQPQDDKTLFTVTAYFAPHGVSGFLYWYAMWPFHKFIFDGLTRRLASRARVLGR